MKIFNKAISLVLCIVIAFSCLGVTGTAMGIAEKEETTEFSYSLKYYTNKGDAYNIQKTLDKVDEYLARKDYSATVNVSLLFVKIPVKIDLSSINAVCESIDKFGSLFEYGTTILSPVIGDLASFNMSSWNTGMRRGAQDITIINELLELLYNNRELIRKLCGGTLDAGVFTETLDLNKIVGPDGIGGTIKKWIISLVYEKDTAPYIIAYNRYKNNIDAFIYGDLLNKYADEYLPGFTMDESSTVEDLICIAFGLIVDKYIKPLISDINIDVATSELGELKALDGLINLKGSTYDFSKIKFDPKLSFLSQVNNVVGEIFTQVIPGYKWKSGNYDKISENIEGAFKYLGKESGLIKNADSLDFNEIVMQVIAVLVKNVDLQGIGDGVTECETLEDMAKVALINLTGNLGLNTAYTNKDSYLLVLGDIAAHFLYNNFSVTDLGGNTLKPGMGYDIFEVANFALNYLLFDKQFASFLGFSTTKSTDVFTKVDKLLDYFGKTKSQGVNFDSKKFLLGDSKTKGILDAAFALDIQYIIEMTAVPALKAAGDVSAVEFIYTALRYFINNWSGKAMIPAYTAGPFSNALKNANVAVMLEYLIGTLRTRNTSMIKSVGFLGGILFNVENAPLGEISARVYDTEYSGGRISPRATVSLAGRTLTQYTDFVVVCTDTKVGSAKAVIKGIGLYKGTSAEYSFNISLGKVEKLTAVTLGDKVTLSWQAIPGIEKYRVTSAKHSEETKSNSIDLPITLGETYTFTVTALTPDGAVSSPATITVKALPKKVSGLTGSNITNSSVTLSWNKVEGAAKYSVCVYDNAANKWVETATPVAESTTVTGLNAGETYKFKVAAVANKEGTSATGEYSDEISVVLKPAKVTNLKVDSKASSTVKLSWSKAKGATHYAVYKVVNGENVKLATVKTTSYTVSGLTPGESYTFKVRGYKSGPGYGDYSDEVKTNTVPAKVTGITTAKTSSSYIKLSWDKAKGATHYVVYVYEDGAWVKYTTTAKTAATVKSLKSGTTYKFRVRAYNTKLKAYSEYSSTHSAKTRVGAVKNLKASSVKKTSLKLSWSKVTGASAYSVYYSTDNKTWKKYDSVSANKITVSSLKSGKTYYFKVRAYSRTNGKVIYSPSYSSVLKVKTK